MVVESDLTHAMGVDQGESELKNAHPPGETKVHGETTRNILEDDYPKMDR